MASLDLMTNRMTDRIGDMGIAIGDLRNAIGDLRDLIEDRLPPQSARSWEMDVTGQVIPNVAAAAAAAVSEATT